MPDRTYIDQYINDGMRETLSLHNLYDTILIGNKNNEDNIFRIATNDFFLKHKDELEKIIQIYEVPDTMYYKPKALSLQLYGTTELWLALLRANNMRNVTEFHQKYIKVYQPDLLVDIIKVYFKREDKY